MALQEYGLLALTQLVTEDTVAIVVGSPHICAAMSNHICVDDKLCPQGAVYERCLADVGETCDLDLWIADANEANAPFVGDNAYDGPKLGAQ